MERENKFWAKETTWIEPRDAALMEALHKLTRNRTIKTTHSPVSLMLTGIQNHSQNHNEDGTEILNSTTTRDAESWTESESARGVENNSLGCQSRRYFSTKLYFIT